ncbi:MAG: hypothetical protein ACM3SP_12585 [Chloroflexota bacterium]
MQRKVLALLTVSFFMIVAAPVFAQSSAPSEQGARPGPGYGYGPGEEYGPGYGYGMGPWMMGPGWGGGYGMGPWMMGPGWQGGYGMGPGMMYGPGYGWGPGYGYGPGEGQPYPRLTPEQREARRKAFVEEYIRRHLPGYSLEKKPPAKTK